MSKSFVQSFTYLKDKPNGDRALHILQRIASLVKPIMRKHSWTLPVLAEFFPNNPSLLGLNINHGQKICIRLRLAHSPATFYEEEDVVQTMLHELTHNVHGPHDEKFYKFLSELQDEYDALQRSGYAGEGFFSEGQRVGSGVSHNLPPHQARLKALEAAEKRRQASRVLGNSGGGNRLGGRINTKGLSPRELAAQAAERRARDNMACASGELADLEAAKAAKDSVENKVIDLTLDDSDPDDIVIDQKRPVLGPSRGTVPKSNQKAPPKATGGKTTAGPSSRQPNPPAPTRNILVDKPETLVNASSGWSCPACTLINEPHSLQCDACFGGRPQDTGSGWTCVACRATGMPHEHWSCRVCGTIKLNS